MPHLQPRPAYLDADPLVVLTVCAYCHILAVSATNQINDSGPSTSWQSKGNGFCAAEVLVPRWRMHYVISTSISGRVTRGKMLSWCKIVTIHGILLKGWR